MGDPLDEALHGVRVPAFVPHPALASGHLQTVVLPFVRPPVMPPGERVEIAVRHGHLVGRLDRVPSARGAAMVLHGINGTSAESFVLRTSRKLQREGLDVLRMNLRGAGESLGRAAGITHSGLTDDIRACVRWLTERYPRVGMVGFSLGGQLLLRTAGEWGDAPPPEVRAVVSISAPIDLERCSVFSERAAASVYRWFIVARLRLRYRNLQGALPIEFDAGRMRGVRTIRDFDEALIAPLHGFRDAMHYYRSASASSLLRGMRVPTVIVHAEDDPLVPIEPVHDALATASKRVRFVITSHGGHVGFLAANPAPGDLDRFWAESRAADFVGRMVTGLEDHSCTLYTERPKGQPPP